MPKGGLRETFLNSGGDSFQNEPLYDFMRSTT